MASPRINVRLPVPLYQRLHADAAQRGVSPSQVVQAALTAYFALPAPTAPTDMGSPYRPHRPNMGLRPRPRTAYTHTPSPRNSSWMAPPRHGRPGCPGTSFASASLSGWPGTRRRTAMATDQDVFTVEFSQPEGIDHQVVRGIVGRQLPSGLPRDQGVRRNRHLLTAEVIEVMRERDLGGGVEEDHMKLSIPREGKLSSVCSVFISSQPMPSLGPGNISSPSPAKGAPLPLMPRRRISSMTGPALTTAVQQALREFLILGAFDTKVARLSKLRSVPRINPHLRQGPDDAVALLRNRLLGMLQRSSIPGRQVSLADIGGEWRCDRDVISCDKPF